MKKEWLIKPLALGIVVLFIGVSYQPIIAEKTISVEKTSEYNNVDFEEAKEYLFQTLIDISNNPEVKQFLNEHKKDLIINNNNDYDCKNAIQKINSQNPKLLKSILFTKPEMTFEYLEKNYNNGLKIIDILGKKVSLKLVNSVKTNQDLIYELKNIIANDAKLSNRVSVLEEMNKNLISNLGFEGHPIICGILSIIILSINTINFYFFKHILQWSRYYNHLLIETIISLLYGLSTIIVSPFILLFIFLCDDIDPHSGGDYMVYTCF